MEQPLPALLRLMGDAAGVAALAPALRIGPLASPGGPSAPDDAPEATWLAREGFAQIAEALEGPTAARLVEAVEALIGRGLPATFIYAFDEPWLLGDALRARISALVGHEYRLVEDVWAWHVPPGRGRGWPPHRGVSDVVLDRTAPEILNVWVALTPATAERACMHAVPLDLDAHYPAELHALDAPLACVRALPVAAGDALFWNANVLHWGGACAERAAGPRVSCSFTLLRESPRAHAAPPLAPLETLSFDARIAAIARQILVYGEGQPDVSETVRMWAKTTLALAQKLAP